MTTTGKNNSGERHLMTLPSSSPLSSSSSTERTSTRTTYNRNKTDNTSPVKRVERMTLDIPKCILPTGGSDDVNSKKSAPLATTTNLLTPTTPISQQRPRRLSISIDNHNKRKSADRIKHLLSEESSVYDREIISEKTTLTVLKTLKDSEEDDPMAMSPMKEDNNNNNRSTGSNNNGTAIFDGDGSKGNSSVEDLFVPLPPPIPNDQLHNPAAYVSNSSKLNPENSFYYNTTSSPSMSPVGGRPASPISPMMFNSEKILRHGNKRRLSFNDEMDTYSTNNKNSSGLASFPPYKKQHTSKLTNSPTMRPSSAGTPSPTILPPSVFYLPLITRKRSGSISSVSSMSSIQDNPNNNSEGIHHYLSNTVSGGVGSFSSPISGGGVSTNGVASGKFGRAQHPPLGQLLNLGGTQGDFGKMSLKEDSTSTSSTSNNNSSNSNNHTNANSSSGNNSRMATPPLYE